MYKSGGEMNEMEDKKVQSKVKLLTPAVGTLPELIITPHQINTRKREKDQNACF